MTHSIVLGATLLRRLTIRFGSVPQCHICGEDFREGDRISISPGSRGKNRRYHEDCLEKTRY